MIKIINTFILASILCFTSFTEPNYKYTIVVFEGSDWCASCRKFENEILMDSKVVAYLQQNFIEVKRIDFPQRKKLSKEQTKINKIYAEKYGFKGIFPTIVFTSLQKEEFYTLKSSNIKPEEFIQWLQSKILLNK